MQTKEITTDFIWWKYQKVEYIWTTWTQYINSWVPTNWWDNIEIEADIKFYQTPTWNNGANGKNNYSWFFFWLTTWNKFYAWAWWYWWYTNVSNDFNKHTFSIKSTESKLYIDWTWYSIAENSWSWTMYSWNYIIWAVISAMYWTYDYKAIEYIYSFKITQWGTLIRDFIPCYRKSDNVIWLLDIVNKVFYTNQWSWSFTKWPDVN